MKKKKGTLREKRKGRGFKKVITGAIAIAAAVTLGVTMIPQDTLAATADQNTSTKYAESLGDNASTEYAGRIWTDKSVFSDATTFEMFGGKKSSQITIDAAKGEDFLVAFSALATSQSISGETQAPIDVVFVIDISGSMSNQDSNMDNGYSRIYNTVQAVNDSIEELMAMNEYTRVGVVAFSNTYQELLPLDRYEKVDGNTDYFSLSKNTAAQYKGQGWNQSLESIYLYTKASPTVGDDINKTTQVVGGTNIQMGMYGGLNMLATETNIYANIEGSQVKRIPSMILLSDGSPTYSSDSSSWWTPANNNSDGPGNGPYVGNGMKALMTGAYMKKLVDANYGVTGTSFAASIYTVGMGITNLPNYEERQQGGGPGGGQTTTVYTGEQDLAYITLNPEDYWTVDNDMANAVEGAWNTYITNDGTPSLAVNTTRNGGYDNYTFTHPTSNDIDTDTDALQTLVTEYYAADSASSVTDVFDEIVSNIALSVPSVPTELGGDLPITQDGYITYTDPIGAYMSVKDVKEIIYAGTEYTAKNVTESTDGTTKTYVFEGRVDSAVYGQQEIKDIIITVTAAADGRETLVVKVPASVIPVRVNTVQLNEDGTVDTHTNNGAYPIRVVYSVGLQDGIKDANGIVDTSKLSADYIAANKNTDGTINFYSNLFTGQKIEHYHMDGELCTTTVGDATVTFEPSHTNPFYYIQKDLLLHDADGDVVVEADLITDANGDLKLKEGTYHYHEPYYHGTEVSDKQVYRTAQQINRTELTVKDGKVYRKAGSPRLNKIMLFEGIKTNNSTNTANDFYLPTFVYGGANQDDAYAGYYKIYLGNNGVLSLPASGSLEISKTVEIGDGLTGPGDISYEFVVDFAGNVTDAYFYDIYNADGTKATTGTNTIADGGKILLKDGQKAVVVGLPHGTEYTVTEKAVAGFTTTKTGDTGTISAGETDVAAFKNIYDVADLTVPVDNTIKAAKVLTGKDWAATDSFTFYLKSRSYETPMPAAVSGESVLTEVAGSHKQLAVTVTAAEGTAKGSSVGVDFGAITYDKPGTYVYEISEDTTITIPGVTYSAAMYEVVVVVTDNGDGTLSADVSMTKNLDDGGQDVDVAADAAVFTNEFEAKKQGWTPYGTKVYTDTSDAKALTNGMFEFVMERVTAGAPMPVNASGDSITVRNLDHDIAYEEITYGPTDVDKTYIYKFTEKAGTINGMSYDTNAYYAKVVVTQNTAGVILVDAKYYSDADCTQELTNGIVFNNTYDPTDATATIKGSKVLNGRVWKDSDEFTFTLTAVNDAAKAITLGKTTEVVKGSDTDCAFDFGTLTFTKPGTYVFNVNETAGSIGGIQYDTHTSVVTITVTDNNGTLVADPVYADGTEAVFTNTYTTTFNTDTAVDLDAIKNLTGRNIRDGEFFFIVEPQDNAPMGRYTAVAVPSGAVTGTAAILQNVVYTTDGTYEYLITEQIPTGATVVDGKYVLDGVTYDSTVYKFKVTVTDDTNGVLAVTDKELTKKVVALDGTVSWEPATEVVFNNAYGVAPETFAAPTLTKEMTGLADYTMTAGEFSFEMNVVSESVPGGVTLPTPATVSNAADGTITFGNLTFTKAGEYIVAIKEVDGSKNYINYSDNVLEAKYTVTDNGLGGLNVRMTHLSGQYTFKNEYVTEGSFTLPITKTFTGRDNNAWLATDNFEFEVVVTDTDTQAAINAGYITFPAKNGDIVRLTIDANTTDHKVTSPAITIHKPGTYHFVVHEVTGTIPGVNYDGTARTIVVNATDLGDGSLNVTYTVDGKTLNNDGQTLEFVNVYDPASVELSGHENLRVIKNFTGRENNAWLAGENGDSFTFKLEAEGATTLQAVADQKVELPNNANGLVVNSNNNIYAHFGNIVFHEVGDYSFKITEVAGPSGNGITYDPAEYVVNVAVTNNTEKAVLEVAVTSITKDGVAVTDNKIQFNNTYKVDETKLDGATNLEVTKVLDGRAWNKDDKFTFVLEAVGDALAATQGDKATVILPDNADGITATQTSQKVAFGDIIFKEAGTYYFEISEVEGTDDNIRYDSHEAMIAVTVTDDNAGNLSASATVTSTGSLTFTNVYTPDPIPVTLTGKKVIDGRTLNENDKFEFTIKAITPGAPMPADTVKTNNTDGTVSFSAIQFTEAGTYKYLISETKGHVAGIDYDTDAVTATVVVINNEAKGALEATVTYVKAGAELGDGFVFTNEYTTHPTDPVNIHATKTVTPSAGNTFHMEAGDFSFGIEPAESNPADDPIGHKTVSNADDGSIAFATASFKQAGTYVYTIHEVDGTKAGIIYDDAVYTVTVKVTDDVANAKLVADVTITKDGAKVDAITFNNGYDPHVATALIHGHKHLLGGHRALAEGEFTFTLTATNEAAKAVTPNPLSAKNTATGLIHFEELQFETVGTYEYVMDETEGNLPGVSYDTTTHKVVIVVTDNEGILNADVTIDGKHYGDVDEMAVFNNTYTPDSTSTDLIGGTKKLDGRPINDGEFEFALIDSNGDEIATAKNVGETFNFEDISFTKAGSYEFAIVEKDTDVIGVTYDLATVYAVYVNVEDNNGKLKVTDIVYVKDNAKTTDVVFNNSYKAENPASIKFGAVKTLTGRALADGEFTFLLTGTDGTKMTATNAADGSILFEEIQFTEAGTYEYVITESKGNDTDVTYDASKYTIVVTVTDDLKGNYVAEITSITVTKDDQTSEVDAVTFVNAYEVPDPGTSPKTNDIINIFMLMAVILVAGFGICGATVYARRR